MPTRNSVNHATLTRRQFVKACGSLIVGVALAGKALDTIAWAAAGKKNSLDASLSSSWFEIHADGTILIRTGRVDLGQA